MSKEIQINPLEPISKPKKKKAVVADEVIVDDEKSNATTSALLDVSDAENSKRQTSAVLHTTGELEELALLVGADCSGSKDTRFDRVAFYINMSMHHILAAGINLIALKEGCEHGEFTAALSERGISDRTARAAMQQVRFVLSVPDTDREKLLSIPKSHVLALASADPEVVEDLLDDDDIDLKALSVRELRQRIKESDRRKTDIATQLEKAELELDEKDRIIKDLREKRVKTGGDVPVEVQDTRLEIAALAKKAELSMQDIGVLVDKMLDGEYDLSTWREAVERHMVSALASLHILSGNLLSSISQDITISTGNPGTLDILSPEEVLRCAQEYKTLTDEHRHEKTLREWERELERPRGKGRPKNKPQ